MVCLVGTIAAGDRTQKRQEMYGAPAQNGDPGGGNGVLNDFSAVA